MKKLRAFFEEIGERIGDTIDVRVELTAPVTEAAMVGFCSGEAVTHGTNFQGKHQGLHLPFCLILSKVVCLIHLLHSSMIGLTP